jgi:hypothetical protein
MVMHICKTDPSKMLDFRVYCDLRLTDSWLDLHQVE